MHMKWLMGGVALLLIVLVTTLTNHAQTPRIIDAKRTVIVRALANDYPQAPFSIKLNGVSTIGELLPALRDAKSDATIPAQLLRRDSEVFIVWIERPLKRGEVRRYRLVFVEPNLLKGDGVSVKKVDSAVEFYINGEFVTAYRYGDAPKPYFYPLIGPTGKAVTRHFPMRKDIPGESTDHLHHRSMWFTFGDVNGIDFWAERAKSGSIQHRSFEAIEGGRVFGRVAAICDWIAPDGRRVVEDRRELTIYCVNGARLLDFNVTLNARYEDVKFGDTKEGMFGLRVACSMRVEGGGGHIVNSCGDKDATAWGKRAEWCDYYGSVDGDTVGIAVFDHPQNFRHPAYWHVRTYGLFAVNPFGMRSFTGVGDGSYTLRKGTSLTFRYRVFIHMGDTQAANVASAYLAYAQPPSITFE